MGKPRKQPSARPGESATTPGRSSPAPKPNQTALKHPRLVRFLAAVLVPALLLGLIELLLRLGGAGYATTFFIPAEDDSQLTTNPKFAWQFYSPAKATSPHPVRFPKEKARGTVRLFILGESAAAGTPDPAYSFWRQLEIMLQEQYPKRRVEVINAAMRGIDSHIVRQIAAECARLDPDLFVVYMGNNDMIGLNSPTPGEIKLSTSPRWFRFQQAIKRTKTAQTISSLLARTARPDAKTNEQTMEFFRKQRLAFNDPQRDSVYENLGQNLRDICRLANAVHAGAMVCTVGSNLRDFPPLGSLHRQDWSAEPQRSWDEHFQAGQKAESAQDHAAAVRHYRAALALDDQFAELHFRLARSEERRGDLEAARRHFTLARDWDALQFRTDSRMNQTIRSVAETAGPGVRLVDMERLFAASSLASNGLPGGNLFHEHVHLRFPGDHWLASMVLTNVASALQLPPPARPALALEECARRLAYTSIDEANMKMAIARLTAHPPFLDQADHAARQAAAEAEVQSRLGLVSREEIEKTIRIYSDAIKERAGDWMLRYNVASFMAQMKQPLPAAEEFAHVVRLMPGQRMLHGTYGQYLLQAGRAREAAAQFEEALRLDPDYEPARTGLKLASSRR